jgi:hypothetical protein
MERALKSARLVGASRIELPAHRLDLKRMPLIRAPAVFAFSFCFYFRWNGLTDNLDVLAVTERDRQAWCKHKNMAAPRIIWHTKFVYRVTLGPGD